MKAEEKAEQARIRAEEKAADHEFAEMLKAQGASQQERNGAAGPSAGQRGSRTPWRYPGRMFGAEKYERRYL